MNTFEKGGGEVYSPDAATLAPAIKQATAQAEALLQEAAKAKEVTLGDLRSVAVQPEIFYGTGTITGFWRIQVVVTRNVKANP